MNERRLGRREFLTGLTFGLAGLALPRQQTAEASQPPLYEIEPYVMTAEQLGSADRVGRIYNAAGNLPIIPKVLDGLAYSGEFVARGQGGFLYNERPFNYPGLTSFVSLDALRFPGGDVFFSGGMVDKKNHLFLSFLPNTLGVTSGEPVRVDLQVDTVQLEKGFENGYLPGSFRGMRIIGDPNPNNIAFTYTQKWQDKEETEIAFWKAAEINPDTNKVDILPFLGIQLGTGWQILNTDIFAEDCGFKDGGFKYITAFITRRNKLTGLEELLIGGLAVRKTSSKIGSIDHQQPQKWETNGVTFHTFPIANAEATPLIVEDSDQSNGLDIAVDYENKRVVEVFGDQSQSTWYAYKISINPLNGQIVLTRDLDVYLPLGCKRLHGCFPSESSNITRVLTPNGIVELTPNTPTQLHCKDTRVGGLSFNDSGVALGSVGGKPALVRSINGGLEYRGKPKNLRMPLIELDKRG